MERNSGCDAPVLWMLDLFKVSLSCTKRKCNLGKFRERLLEIVFENLASQASFLKVIINYPALGELT